MVRPHKIRCATPQTVRKIWNAIAYIRQGKQIPNRERIKKYMSREFEMRSSEIDKEINLAVKDNLVISYTNVGSKGSKVGEEQEGFKLPEPEFNDRGDNDWYCFTCHKTGEVLTCTECWRVFHPICTDEDWTGSVFLCHVCKAGRKKKKLKPKQVSKLLGYTIQRLKDKARELHQVAALDDDNRLQRLVYMPMDLNAMEEKVLDGDYKIFEEFTADARAVLHNVVITHGEFSDLADLANVIVNDCDYEVQEIRKCTSCYYYSNSRSNKDWFSQPCDPPHELVYAKLKGYCYWPAKVIRIVDEEYDVRFFGPPHQRAMINKNTIKPISTNMKELAPKKTQSFVKACEELKKHQSLLKKRKRSHDEDSESEEDNMETDDPPDNPPDNPPDITSSSRDTEGCVVKVKKLKESHEESDRLVTSSQDMEKVPRLVPAVSTVGTQTKKMTTPAAEKVPTKAQMKSLYIQTDRNETESKSESSKPCNCEEKYSKKLEDMKTEVENEYELKKEDALKELEERLKKNFEEDKESAVKRALGKIQQESEKVRKQTEEKCKADNTEDMKKITQKHKAEISATKKKQWCYNCEEEAMYHCCWNTSYCSIKCQQQHWHKEHKKVCRRKR